MMNSESTSSAISHHHIRSKTKEAIIYLILTRRKTVISVHWIQWRRVVALQWLLFISFTFTLKIHSAIISYLACVIKGEEILTLLCLKPVINFYHGQMHAFLMRYLAILIN